VDRLIGRGWVMREQPPGNRRVMHARLTDEGVKAPGHDPKAYFSALREILTERLADPQIATLTELTAGFLSGPDRHQPRPRPASTEPLTGRELDVLRLLTAGSSNQRIAHDLVVALDTIKKHVTHILGKLGAANRTEAVALARQLGLIP
jgi:LuxR family maltose regulon positive regulatory protein